MTQTLKAAFWLAIDICEGLVIIGGTIGGTIGLLLVFGYVLGVMAI